MFRFNRDTSPVKNDYTGGGDITVTLDNPQALLAFTLLIRDLFDVVELTMWDSNGNVVGSDTIDVLGDNGIFSPDFAASTAPISSFDLFWEGSGSLASFTVGNFVPSSVPEPSSSVLLLVAMPGLVRFRRS